MIVLAKLSKPQNYKIIITHLIVINHTYDYLEFFFFSAFWNSDSLRMTIVIPRGISQVQNHR
jgi:hypothetical protein